METPNIKLLKMSAKWCGPCKTFAPTVESVMKQFENIQVVHLDVDEDEEGLAARYGVKSIPTLILLKDDEPVGTLVGVHPASKLKEFIEKNI